MKKETREILDKLIDVVRCPKCNSTVAEDTAFKTCFKCGTIFIMPEDRNTYRSRIIKSINEEKRNKKNSK